MEKLVVIQRRQLIEELVPKYRVGFANFDIFADGLNEFILPNLSTKEFDILSRVYVLLFFLAIGSQLRNVVLAQIRNT